MLRKVLVVACFMLVFGSGCHESTAIPAAMVQLLSPTDTSTSQPIATNTSTPQPTATMTLKPRPTLKPVGELTQQAEARADFYTLTPTRTPTPTPTVTPTPTPLPVAPLVAHDWTTEPVLLRFGQIGGDGADPLDYSLPSLILYSDGTLIYRQWAESSDGAGRLQLWQVDLDRQKICALLNTIDQAGFFDYDPKTYVPEGQYLSFDGSSSTVIEVNAWRSKHISLYGLWVFLNDEPSMARAIVLVGRVLCLTFRQHCAIRIDSSRTSKLVAVQSINPIVWQFALIISGAMLRNSLGLSQRSAWSIYTTVQIRGRIWLLLGGQNPLPFITRSLMR